MEEPEPEKRALVRLSSLRSLVRIPNELLEESGRARRVSGNKDRPFNDANSPDFQSDTSSKQKFRGNYERHGAVTRFFFLD